MGTGRNARCGRGRWNGQEATSRSATSVQSSRCGGEGAPGVACGSTKRALAQGLGRQLAPAAAAVGGRAGRLNFFTLQTLAAFRTCHHTYSSTFRLHSPSAPQSNDHNREHCASPQRDEGCGARRRSCALADSLRRRRFKTTLWGSLPPSSARAAPSRPRGTTTAY